MNFVTLFQSYNVKNSTSALVSAESFYNIQHNLSLKLMPTVTLSNEHKFDFSLHYKPNYGPGHNSHNDPFQNFIFVYLKHQQNDKIDVIIRTSLINLNGAKCHTKGLFSLINFILLTFLF